jgi:uncharacterized phage protein (TIGR02218 family)
MRNVTTGLDGALQQTTTTLARLWKITRTDGVVITITDATRDVTTLDGTVYTSSNGFTCTPILTSSQSIGSQSVQLTVPLTDLGINDFDLRHRLFEGATAVLSLADYLHPEYDVMVYYSGQIGRVVMSDKKRATLDVISKTDPNLFVAGESYCQSCRNDLGDSNCQFPIFNLAFNFTVTAVTDQLAFTVDTLAGQDDDAFALGQIKWLTGNNKLLIADVRTNNSILKSVGLFYPMPRDLQVGDTGQLLLGCDKQLTTCFKKFNNVLNFRAEPFAPSFGG